eukprot:scaffold39725_cov133-Skeletonema_dohrnii-CCMP3373.AAC.2
MRLKFSLPQRCLRDQSVDTLEKPLPRNSGINELRLIVAVCRLADQAITVSSRRGAALKTQQHRPGSGVERLTSCPETSI